MLYKYNGLEDISLPCTGAGKKQGTEPANLTFPHTGLF